MTTVVIKNGSYRNMPVHDVAFTLVKDFQMGAKGGFVTVKSDGFFGEEFDEVRVKVDGIEDIEIAASDITTAEPVVTIKAPVETDEDVMDRIE